MIIEKYVIVGERGQIAIPKEMRDIEHIYPKQRLKIIRTEGELIIRTMKAKLKPEEQVLNALEDAKLTDEDWIEIQKDRER